MENLDEIVINLAGDLSLTRDLLNYLKTSNLLSDSINTVLIGDEIRIFLKGNNDIRRVKTLAKGKIGEYLHSTKLFTHAITEFDNILVVGIPKEIYEISNLLTCEICGWKVNTEEELLIHRRTHWI